MTPRGTFPVLSAVAAILAGPALSAQADAPGSKDHRLFSRMSGFFIEEFTATDFDAHTFTVRKGQDDWEQVPVEGRKTVIAYTLREGQNPPSGLQVVRNYANAATQAGGKVLFENQDPGNRILTVKFQQAGQEIWAQVEASDGAEGYRLVVVERASLQQEVTATVLFDALAKTGRASLAIQFDTGKATIRPASAALIKEAAAMLAAHPDLKVSVEGHTDNTGTPAGNRTLSEQRARAVVAALAALGVEGSRMTAAGHGQDRPVAGNETEAGRAQNRRVELVKR